MKEGPKFNMLCHKPFNGCEVKIAKRSVLVRKSIYWEGHPTHTLFKVSLNEPLIEALKVIKKEFPSTCYTRTEAVLYLLTSLKNAETAL